MKTKIFAFVFTLIMTAISGSAQNGLDPIDAYISMETDRLELEEELFGFGNDNDEIISLFSIELYELEEDIVLEFDTAKYLPSDFDPYKGMNRLNWDNIPLYEVEEEIELNFDSKSSTAGISSGK